MGTYPDCGLTSRNDESRRDALLARWTIPIGPFLAVLGSRPRLDNPPAASRLSRYPESDRRFLWLIGQKPGEGRLAIKAAYWLQVDLMAPDAQEGTGREERHFAVPGSQSNLGVTPGVTSLLPWKI